MAVAEKPAVVAKQKTTSQQLAINSAVGGLLLFLAIGFVLSGLPVLWEVVGIDALLNNAYLSTSLLIFAACGAAFGLVYAGRKLEEQNPLKGQRAGAVIFCIGLFLIMVIGLWLANTAGDPTMGFIMGLVLSVALLGGLLWVYRRPGWSKWLLEIEEQGWFHATSFKPNQGVRVRRGTLVALLTIIAAGVYSAIDSNLYGTGNWSLNIPMLNRRLYLLFNVQYMAPLITMFVFGWMAWRATNWPTFADFLIATEAEVNKVSWTTRRRLWQDTIVVLVTVALLTVFLFIVDLLWIQILSAQPVPGVLIINPREARAAQQTTLEW